MVKSRNDFCLTQLLINSFQSNNENQLSSPIIHYHASTAYVVPAPHLFVVATSAATHDNQATQATDYPVEPTGGTSGEKLKQWTRLDMSLYPLVALISDCFPATSADDTMSSRLR